MSTRQNTISYKLRFKYQYCHYFTKLWKQMCHLSKVWYFYFQTKRPICFSNDQQNNCMYAPNPGLLFNYNWNNCFQQRRSYLQNRHVSERNVRNDHERTRYASFAVENLTFPRGTNVKQCSIPTIIVVELKVFRWLACLARPEASVRQQKFEKYKHTGP